MLANVATNIKTRSTTLGFDPAAFKMRVAVMTSSLVFDRTAAMVKPPIRSMIVGENIWEKMYLQVVRTIQIVMYMTHLVESAAVIRLSFPSEVRRTRRKTTSSGAASEVTKRGMAYISISAIHLGDNDTYLSSP